MVGTKTLRTQPPFPLIYSLSIARKVLNFAKMTISSHQLHLPIILVFKVFFYQELLTKDIPSVQMGKERRYNRRPILTSLLNAKGEDLEASGLGNALEGESDRQLPERETPSISVENMTATWGKVCGS